MAAIDRADPVRRARSDGARHARRIGARAGGRRRPGGARTRRARGHAARRPVAGRARSHWHAMAPPLGRPELRWLRARRVASAGPRHRAPTSIMERYYNFGGEGVLAARRLGVPAVLEVNAPDRRLSRVDEGRARSRAARPADAAMARSAVPADEPVRHADGGRFCRRGSIAGRCSKSSGAPTSIDFRPDAPGRPAVHAATRIGFCCVFAGAFRSWHGVAHLSAALARLHARRRPPVRRASSSATARSARPPSARPRGVPGVHLHRRAAARASCPRRSRAADIGVAPFDPARHAPLQLGFYWSPLKIFEYMAAGLPVVAPALAAAQPARRARTRGTAVRSERSARRSTARSSRWPIRRCGGGWARPRARASSATSAGTAHCAALDARLRALVTAMSAPLRVLIVTDSFPPVCGGSGWSTWELVARPASRAGITSRS